jgi:hypothetical protein
VRDHFRRARPESDEIPEHDAGPRRNDRDALRCR